MPPHSRWLTGFYGEWVDINLRQFAQTLPILIIKPVTKTSRWKAKTPQSPNGQNPTFDLPLPTPDRNERERLRLCVVVRRSSRAETPRRGGARPLLSVQAGSHGRRHAWAVYCTVAGFGPGWLRKGRGPGRRSAPWGALMDCYLAGGPVCLPVDQLTGLRRNWF